MGTQPESLGFLLSDISRLMRRVFARRLQGSPMTLAQAKALMVVSRHEGIRQVDIAELLDIQPITLARLIDHLAREGLVERRPDPDDRRAYQLFVLPAAAPHLEFIRQLAESVQAEILGDLGQSDVDLLFPVLRKLRDSLAAR
jgi:DNA-binding MarR family transcriptional regulator